MVAVGGESPLDLQGVLTSLESKSSSSDNRLEAYKQLTRQLVDGELSIFEQDIQQEWRRLLKVAQRDVLLSGGILESVAQQALHVMQYCLHEPEIVRFVAAQEVSIILGLLCQVTTRTTEKATCSCAITCLARQSISHDIVTAEVSQILSALETARTKWKSDVDAEILAVINRLFEQCEKAMTEKCPEWGRVVLSQLVSTLPKVREQAFTIVQKWTTALSCSKPFVTSTLPEVKMSIVPELKKLFQGGQEMYTVKVWELLVKIFSEELSQSSFTNLLLAVIQPAFTVSSMEVRALAFHSWRVFITVMSEIPNWLMEPRHLKLIMQVFPRHNTRSDDSSLEKLKAWWCLAKCLGSRLWDNCDLVIRPLLEFSAGSVKSGRSQFTGSGTPSTPRMAFESGLKSPPTPKSPSGVVSPPSAKLQLLGFEILAHLVGDAPRSPSLSSVSFSLDPLKPEVTVSATSFIKNYNILITTMFDLVKSLGTKIPEPLLLYVWQGVIGRLRTALESSVRGERREPLSVFLGQFQVLVLSQVLPHQLTLKLFQSVCSLPSKVLSSTAFSISGQSVKGSPAQFLCEVLLTPVLMKECMNSERFMTVLSSLVLCTSNHPAGFLEFCQHVLETLDRNAQFLPGPEALWRLWSIMAHSLLDHVAQTNEVNQGDSLEFNFDCMYATLMLPLSHQLGAVLSQPSSKTMMKTWSDLYRTFARLSALVTNAEANIAVEMMSQRILDTLQKENCLKDGAMLEYVISVCHIIVDTIDFSSLAPPQAFSLGISASPSKWTRRRHRPMGNLHSFVSLVTVVMQGIVEGVKAEGEEPPVFAKQKPHESASQLNVAAITSLDVVTHLVTHVTVSGIICHMIEKLAPLLAGLMTIATKKTPVKLHTPASLQKLEKLWLDICTMLQSRYKGPYDSELLAQVSPLLQATFIHTRRQIKNQTVLLWNATFARSAPLTYPSDLQPVLKQVKEKTQLMLPGWVNVDVAVIAETPYSQMSQPDSMAPEPVIPGMPSPTRLRGSFLSKDRSPSPRPPPTSPSPRIVTPSEHRPFGGSARKKLSVDFMPDEDFVVITDTPKRRRILTEHQKEVLREKPVIPAMYNNLDLSQDVSLMSQFSISDTQQDTMTSTPGTAQCVIMVNSSQSQDQQKQVADLPEKQDVAASHSAEQMPAPTPRRSSRRKSVHFEDSSNSTPASKDSDNSSGEVRPWKVDPNESSRVSQSRESVRSSKSSSGDASEKSDNELQSADLPHPEPNLLAVIGEKLVESLSSKEPTLSSVKSSSGSSGEQKSADSLDENDPFFRPFKSFSQSLSVARTHLSEKSVLENSVRMLTRKTRSQEIIGSAKPAGKDQAAKTGSDRPVFTGLEKWLRKSPTVTNKFPTVTNKSPIVTSPEVIADSPPLNQPTRMFVEETQSPKDMADVQEALHESILETPTKTSAAAAFSEHLQSETAVIQDCSVNQHANSPSKFVSFDLKQPVLQLQRLSDVRVGKGAVDSRPVPMEIEVTEDSKKDVPDVIVNPSSPTMDEAALHETLPQINDNSTLVASQSSHLAMKVTQKTHSPDHENLFGFSELLEQSDNTGSKEYTLSSPQEQDAADKGIVANTEEKITEDSLTDMGCSELTPTLLSTATSKHISTRILDKASESPSISSSLKSSRSPEQDEDPSQVPFSQSDSEVADFDPMKDSTLTDDHAKKRKQRTPKKIDPEKLRRTSRKKRSRISLCPCCKDGQNPHHTKMHKEASQQHTDKDQTIQETEENFVTQTKDKGLSGTCEKKEISVVPLKQTANELLESLDTMETKVNGDEENSKLSPSPQDVEKTPELKSSSTVTPIRKSTTKTKLEAARRRSISKSFLDSPGRNGKSDSDSDDLPLSHLVPSSGEMTNIVEKGSSLKKEEIELSGKTSSRQVHSASKLKLRKLSRFGKILHSPPKLRLRQKKEGESRSESMSSTADTREQVEAKSYSKPEDSQIEDVASEDCLTNLVQNSITDFTTPSAFMSGLSKSTGKKNRRKVLVKRLTPSPSYRHLRSNTVRLRSTARGRLSLPPVSGSRLKCSKVSPASTRVLRRQVTELSQQQDDDVKVTERVSEEDLPVHLFTETRKKNQSLDVVPVPSNAVSRKLLAVNQDKPMETEASLCATTALEDLEVGKEQANDDASRVLPVDPLTTVEKKTHVTCGPAEQEQSKRDVDQGTQPPTLSRDKENHLTQDADSDCSFHSCPSDQEETAAHAPVKMKENDLQEVAVKSSDSEEMFDSLGFSLDKIDSKEPALSVSEAPTTHALTEGDCSEASAALFSEPDACSEDVASSSQKQELWSCLEHASAEVSPAECRLSDSLKDTKHSSAPSLQHVPVEKMTSVERTTPDEDMPTLERMTCNDQSSDLNISTHADQLPSDAGKDLACITETQIPSASASSPDVECAVATHSEMKVEKLLKSTECTEHVSQTDITGSVLSFSDSCKICGSCMQKNTSGDDGQIAKQLPKEVATQTESSAVEMGEAEIDEDSRSSFTMITKDAAHQITPLKNRKLRRSDGSSSTDTTPGSPRTSGSALAASDSKLARVRRLHQRFVIHSDRGISMVRRSLLHRHLQKQFGGYSVNSDDQITSSGRDESNKEPDTVRTLPPLSPTISPSSGILKKRQLDSVSGEDVMSQDESPTPSKKRRVSFAEPIVSGESPSHEATLNKMPWRWESLSKKSGAYMPRELIMSDLQGDAQATSASSSSSQVTETSQASSQTSQNSYHSTQESQLNATDAIFPELVECDKPVDIVLPQLTSAAWHRGLRNMMAANGITTIGKLAAQTEVEIQSMPFRAPKAEVVREALLQYYRAQGASTANKAHQKSAGSGNVSATLDRENAGKNTVTPDDEHDTLLCAEEALRQLSPIKGETADAGVEDSDVFETENNPDPGRPMEDLDDQVNMNPQSPRGSGTSHQNNKISLLERFSSLASEDLDELQHTKKEDLLAIHQQLSLLTSKVVSALVSRCPSPPQPQ